MDDKKRPIRLLIADDHKMMLDGLKSLLKGENDIDIMGEATNGKHVLQILQQIQIDVAIIDISMPEMDGYETVLYLREHYPQTKVLILSLHKDEKHIGKLLKAGVSGYIIKDRGSDELVTAIRTIASGKEYYDSEVMAVSIRAMQNRNSESSIELKFTTREKEVLHLIADGLSSKEIGEKLFVEPSTVETHRKNLLEKLNLPNSKQLMKYAIEKGYGNSPLS